MSNEIKQSKCGSIETKTFLVIESVTNMDQFKVAENYIELFNKMFNDEEAYYQLLISLKHKRNQLNQNG